MYLYEWDLETHGFRLTNKVGDTMLPLRPVYHEELDILGFRKFWDYPHVEHPLLWAEGSRRYFHDGRLVAELIGGGFYTDPTIDIKEDDLVLEPVNLGEMVRRNRKIALGLEQKAIELIYDTWAKHKGRDAIYVAFSGGKDSAVLLDLVFRALGRNDFVTIFGDTGMELPDTYEAFEEAKKRYPNLEEATSALSPDQSWEIFGPPSRRQRWCCSVHKSAPSILKLRELLNKQVGSILVFDGVRADESHMRADYSEVTNRAKHAVQINARPILAWNSAEVFNYIFTHRLHLNGLYRKGFVRAGCIICPMSFGWRDFMTRKWFPDLLEPYIKTIASYASIAARNKDDIKNYIEEGGWMARVGGQHLPQARILVTEVLRDNMFTQEIECNRMQFFQWGKALPEFTMYSANSGSVTFKSGRRYEISVEEIEEGLRVSYSPVLNQFSERTELKYLRMLANKAAYCVKCRACEAECLYGALSIGSDGIEVNEELCQHCLSCFTFDKGCLVAKSLHVSKGAQRVKSFDRYHSFGMEIRFMEPVFEGRAEDLGTKQLPAIKTWLREANVLEGDELTDFGRQIQEWGLSSTRSWSLIWINLVYASPIVNWFVRNVPEEKSYSKVDLVDLLEVGAERTRANAIDALINTLKNPLISDYLGQGNVHTLGGKRMVRRTAWKEPDLAVVLYALYRYAEAEGGRYSFTLSQLMNEPSESGLSPSQLFCLSREQLASLLRGLAINQPSFISVELALGLDNINLSPERNSADVLKHLF